LVTAAQFPAALAVVRSAGRRPRAGAVSATLRSGWPRPASPGCPTIRTQPSARA